MRRRASPIVLVAAIASLSAAACEREHLGPTVPHVDAGTITPATDAGVAPTTDAGTPSDAGGPFPMVIQFRNDTDLPLFLHKGCVGLDYGVSSGASGFRDRLGPTYHCGCYCDEPTCTNQPTCGACPQPESEVLEPGGMLAIYWDATQTTDEEKPRGGGLGGTFWCVRSRALPAGSYRVAIRVFDTMDSAVANLDGRVVTRDFELPANAYVDVPLSPSWRDTCDPGASANLPTCTGAEAHDVPCNLVDPLSFAWEGGLSLWGDTSQLTPQSSYGRVRRFYQDATKPDMTCVTEVPRCARDSRVVTTADVTRVLYDPSVLAAYGAGTPIYGYDQRANDGAVLILRRPNATSLAIGSTCTGPCSISNPLTPALTAVGPVLQALDQQMISTSACAAFRTGTYY